MGFCAIKLTPSPLKPGPNDREVVGEAIGGSLGSWNECPEGKW